MVDTPAPVDPTQDALLGMLRHGLVILGTVLAGHGVIGPNNTITPGNWEFIVGAVVTIAPIAWSWWAKFQAAKTAKAREAIAVQAGVNLATAGAALAMDGSTIKTAQTAPTLPVTAESAVAIIRNFGPLPSPPGTTADDLNTRSLASVKGTSA